MPSESGMPTDVPQMPPMPPVMGHELAVMPQAPPAWGVQEPPAKKRRLKGVDEESLSKLLSGLHQCLKKLVSNPAGKPFEGKDVPVQCLEEEFERHWRLHFDARALGELNTGTFLKRFPDVFQVKSNGLYLMVGPVENPNFDKSAENGIEQADSVKDAQAATSESFAVSFGEQIISLLANFVAEERKASGAPLNYQFANYDVVQDLLGGLRDGNSKEQETTLLGQLVDPKPQAPKEEMPPVPPKPEPERDQRDHDRYGDLPDRRKDEFRRDEHDRRDRARDDWRNNDRDDYGRGRPGYGGGGGNWHSNNDNWRGGGGGGGGYSNYKTKPCQHYRNGRCTYGDNCKFLHE